MSPSIFSVQKTFSTLPYTPVHNLVTLIGAELPLPLFDTDAERLEAEAFHQNRIESESARMATEVEKLKYEIPVEERLSQIRK